MDNSESGTKKKPIFKYFGFKQRVMGRRLMNLKKDIKALKGQSQLSAEDAKKLREMTSEAKTIRARVEG